MEIRNILRGETAGFAACPARTAEGNKAAIDNAAADRVDLSRRWAEQMEDQRKQLLALLSQPAGQDKGKKSGGILDMLDGAENDREELDALSRQMKVRMKCLEIARRIMQGKKVPPKDELYLMENDPAGYKLAMALRKPPKKNEKECKSVLDDEDGQSGRTPDSGDAVPAEAGDGSSAASDGGEPPE